jgi:hypothetical protein
MRLWITAETSGRSSALAVSFSMIDASVSVSRTLNPRAAASARSSPSKARSKRATIARTASAAPSRRGQAYVSGNRYPSSDRALESNAATSDGSAAASMNSAGVPRPLRPKISAISMIVRPSGKVTECEKTSPATSRAMTSLGVLGPAKRYSPL